MIVTFYQPGPVEGEAGERLQDLTQKSLNQGLSVEELAEYNQLVAAHVTNEQSFYLPDFRDLGVTDPEQFLENARHAMHYAETAYRNHFFIEAVSLRMLLLDFILRAFIVDRTGERIEPYSRRDQMTFGQIVTKAHEQRLPHELTDRLRAFSKKRNAAIHNFFLGRASYQKIGDAYRDADRLYEGIVEALVTRAEET